jgi:hypothetical protein
LCRTHCFFNFPTNINNSGEERFCRNSTKKVCSEGFARRNLLFIHNHYCNMPIFNLHEVRKYVIAGWKGFLFVEKWPLTFLGRKVTFLSIVENINVKYRFNVYIFEILNGICYCQTNRETHVQISNRITAIYVFCSICQT